MKSFLNNLKFQKDVALNMRAPMNGSKAMPSIISALGKEIIVEDLDYRGIPVIAAIRTIDGSPWFLATYKEKAEVFGPLKERILVISILFGFLLISMLLLIYFIWRQQNLKLYKKNEKALQKINDELENRVKERTETLLKSEDEFRLIIESVNDYAIIMLDKKGNITRWNVGAEKLKGYKSDEIIGKHFSLFYPKEDIDKGKPEMELVKADAEGSFEDEGWRIRKDGSYFWANVIINAIRGQSGELIGYSKITRDITQRKKTENWKQRQNEILETISKNEPLSTTFELIVKSVEEEDPDSLCSILLLDKEGKHLLNAAAPSLPEFYIQAINGNEIGEKAGSCGAAAYSKKRVIAEDLLTHPNWEPYLALTQQENLRSCWSEPILDSRGNCLGAFAIYHRKPCVPQNEEIELLKSIVYLASLAIVHKRDEENIRDINSGLEIKVEERTQQLVETNRSLYKEIEERKKDGEELLVKSVALEAAVAAIVISDSDGLIEWVNPAFTTLTGYTNEEVKGENPRVLKSGKHDKAFYKNIWDTILAKKAWCGEIINKRKDGSEYYEEMTIAPVMAQNGEIIRFIAIKQDISERKRFEDELSFAKNEAEQANMAKSDFLARMSHEIRTPLNAIIGITHLTLHTELNKKQADNLKKVYSSATSLLSIINDILDFSKIEANKLELEQIEFDLEEVFRELTSLITYKALDKNLEIAFSLPRSVPNNLKGDPLRLGQILNNLSINAIKYTEKGEIVIKIELAEKKNGKVKLLFSVKDTGIGLSKEETLRLFKSFSQADVSTTRNYGGTGLGLAICKKLTEIMGGEIWVESTKGQGSTFFFTAWFGLGEQTKSKKFLVPDDLRGMKALVCDDNETACEILKEALETFKFDVTTVTSGKDALEELLKSSNEPYKLVLMDWIMPEMNGLQAAKLIMTNKKISTPPKIIMVTAFDREEVRSEVEETGIAGILIKPVGNSDLYNTILETFGKTAQIKLAEKKIHTISADILQQVHGALVLLVEDNDINQDVAVGILEEAGATAEIANNGKEAVRMVMASGKPPKYKLVLMDLRMPVMDGYDATIEIRKQKDYNDLPIIAMTADAISGIKEKCLKAGMNDFISKPIDPKNFYNTLAQWITYSESNNSIKSKTLDPVRLPETDDTAKIPEIKGLDTSDGLRRINNNTDLYLKLLGKFSKNYSTFINELKRSLEEGLIEESERMVHTLKGVSGNIGATDLHSFSVTLDDKLKTKQIIDIKSEMSDLSNFLIPILNSINQVLSKEEVNEREHQKDLDVDIDTVQFKKLLNELSILLEKSDFDSAKKADELSSIKGIGKYYEEIRKIRELISDYEFDEAKTIVDKLIKID
jgi:PAS domain S-box-containing protein